MKKSTIALALAAVLGVTAGARADWHYVPDFRLNFDDSWQWGATAMTATGSATLSGAGTYYSWSDGSPGEWQAQTISFNTVTVPIGTNPNTINYQSSPGGNALVSFEVSPNTLQQGSLEDLYVDVKHGAGWTVTLDQMVLAGQVSGGPSVYFYLDTAGSIDSYTFDMTGLPTGIYVSGTFPSITYTINPDGTLSASYSATVTGRLVVEGALDEALGTLLSPSGSLSSEEAITGTMTLTELAGPYPKDVAIVIHADTAGQRMPLQAGGSYDFNNYSGGTTPYYAMSLSYVLDGSVELSSAYMDLYDTVPIMPEPTTQVLLGLVGVLLAGVRRRPSGRRGTE